MGEAIAIAGAGGGRVALVTGASGFVGSRLVGGLARAGWKVGAVVRAESEVGGWGEGVEVFRLGGDGGGIGGIVREVGPGVVFHLASLFVAEHGEGDVSGLVRANVEFGAELLEGMRGAGVKRLVNTGTAWQHYRDLEYSPVNLYAATKGAFEAILRFYEESEGVGCVTLKLFDTYGPGDGRMKLLPLLLKAAERGEELGMTMGEGLVDFTYIDDVVGAYLVAAGRLMEGGEGSFVVRSGREVRIRDLVGMVEAALGKGVKVVWGAREYRKREVMRPWGGGVVLPGWRAGVTLEEGLRRTIEGR